VSSVESGGSTGTLWLDEMHVRVCLRVEEEYRGSCQTDTRQTMEFLAKKREKEISFTRVHHQKQEKGKFDL